MGVTVTKPLQVVFFGSGPVAAESLHLVSQYFTVEAVVTKPTTIEEMTETAANTPVYTVRNRTELDDLIATNPFTSQVAILIDFGIIVSRSVIDSFAYGIINSHFSLLPEWRGADPISFAILSGQEKTGVSLMLIDEGMDTGKILATRSIAIDTQDTGNTLTAKLIELSGSMLEEFVPKYLQGDITPRQQSHPDRATYSRKLTKEDGILDWNKAADVLEREIRAFQQWPKSRTMLKDKELLITKAHATEEQPENLTIGDIYVSDKADGFGFVTSRGILWVDEVKPAGKKEMTVRAFLAGYKHLLN